MAIKMEVSVTTVMHIDFWVSLLFVSSKHGGSRSLSVVPSDCEQD